MSDSSVITDTSQLTGWKKQRADELTDAAKFIAELKNIQTHDRGRMSVLKRNAGETRFAQRGTAWFDWLMPRAQWRYREVYFLVATLFDFHRRITPLSGNFGVSMLRLAHEMGKEPKDFRRFHILLDAEFETIHDRDDSEAPWSEGGGEMAYRLRQMVKLMASKGIGIDWPQLLVDLCHWSRPSREVQKKWARTFFDPKSSAPAPLDEAEPTND